MLLGGGEGNVNFLFFCFCFFIFIFVRLIAFIVTVLDAVGRYEVIGRPRDFFKQ